MKFSDGYWKVKENTEVYNATRAFDFEKDGESLQFYASIIPIVHKGQSLNSPLITVRMTAPIPEVIRVQIWHHKGKVNPNNPSFLPDRPVITPGISEDEQTMYFTSGRLQARIKKNAEWSIDYYNGETPLTGCTGKSTGFVRQDGKAYIKEELSLGVGETVYGLGERFAAFVKNGQQIDIWNRDGGTSSEQAYKNIPFYLTNRGYGVLVNDAGLVSFEVASEKVERVQFSAEGEYLDYCIINGGSPMEVLKNYAALTGKPSLPPAWSFGLWLSTSFTTDYDEETVTSFIESMEKNNIPLSVFHFDCFWMKYFHWCNFIWDQDVFPHPEEMLARLKARGLKICVWINPYIAQRSHLFDEGMEKGYLLREQDGTVWQTDEWQAGMGIVDFTNPNAAKWYTDELKKLMRMGVDVFKTDFGERIPVNVRYYNGANPERMHNYYTHLYNKAVFDAIIEVKGEREAVLFARSATCGGQMFPVHWGGDCMANYESMAESLRGGLSLSLCGFGFWSHDISGFESTATPDLYKRWAAFGMLSTHSRLHGNVSYRVPWLFDDEAVDVLRHFTNLKARLMPYLFQQAVSCSETGVPMMRPMVLAYPTDPACEYIDRQYMLGDSLLVAPIFDPTGRVSYYLPQGRWTHLLSNEELDGAGWHTETHDYFSLPLMVRENSIIALGSCDSRPDYEYARGVELHLFHITEQASVQITEPDGRVSFSAQAEKDNKETAQTPCKTIHFTTDALYTDWRVCLRNIPAVRSVSGGKAEPGQYGVMITPDADATQLVIELE